MRKLLFVLAVIAGSFEFHMGLALGQGAKPDTPVTWFSDVGLDKLPQAVAWVRRLDAEWQKLLQGETRAQRLRQVKRIAIATKELELDCLTTESALRAGIDATSEIEQLRQTVVRLREQMMRLSTDLGEQLGKDGLDIAQQFADFTIKRGVVLGQAAERLKNASPADRTAAADYLRRAAQIASEAHEALVLFIRKSTGAS